MWPKADAYKKMSQTIIKQFERRGIEGYYCENKQKALEVIHQICKPGSSVSFGGSQTLNEIGFFEYINHLDYTVYDRALAQTPEEKEELNRNVVNADYYFMSSNAITINGELVNIDGYGNRVANLCFGPKNVVIIAGMNKMVTDVEAAIARVRNMASPPNVMRLNKNTPCAKTGVCGNCLSDDCICCQVVVTRKSSIKNRIKVILVGEELGF